MFGVAGLNVGFSVSFMVTVYEATALGSAPLLAVAVMVVSANRTGYQRSIGSPLTVSLGAGNPVIVNGEGSRYAPQDPGSFDAITFGGAVRDGGDINATSVRPKPTAHARSGPSELTLWINGVLDNSSVHVIPPSLVSRMPCGPTTRPLSMSEKLGLYRALVLPEFTGCQFL